MATIVAQHPYQPPGGKSIPWDKLSVLVVDDSVSTRHLIRDMLHALGVVQVFEAQNGKEALKFIDCADMPLDIVVCDWNMPTMTGLELLQQTRGVDSRRAFLLITGRHDSESVMEARGAGVDGYIVKPFSALQLRNKISAVLLSKKQGVLQH